MEEATRRGEGPVWTPCAAAGGSVMRGNLFPKPNEILLGAGMGKDYQPPTLEGKAPSWSTGPCVRVDVPQPEAVTAGMPHFPVVINPS